jgi:hypothetical protein
MADKSSEQGQLASRREGGGGRYPTSAERRRRCRGDAAEGEEERCNTWFYF